MPDTDLFGQLAVEPLPRALSDGPCRPSKPNGYAAPPGTGPKGETCKTCKNLARKGGCSRYYLKCLLVKARWTGGAGTDVKAGSPACAGWEKAKNGD